MHAQTHTHYLKKPVSIKLGTYLFGNTAIIPVSPLLGVITVIIDHHRIPHIDLLLSSDHINLTHCKVIPPPINQRKDYSTGVEELYM